MEPKIYIPLLLVVFAALVTLLYVFVLFRKVSKLKLNNKRVEELEKYIHGGAMTFLVREYKIIIPFVIGVGVVLAVLGFIPALKGAEAVGWKAAICFVVGACFSAAAGWIGMAIATKANARTAIKAQEEGMSGALKTAFGGGAVLGLAVFIGLTMYDFQKIKNMGAYCSDEDVNSLAMFGALQLYLDFINIFLKLLRLFADRRN